MESDELTPPDRPAPAPDETQPLRPATRGGWASPPGADDREPAGRPSVWAPPGPGAASRTALPGPPSGYTPPVPPPPAGPPTARIPAPAPPPGGRGPGIPKPAAADAPSGFRRFLAGTVVGALVGAAVAGGIVAAQDDQPTQVVQLPSDNVVLDGEPTDVKGILARVGPSVVTIHTEATQGRIGGLMQSGAGSGFILREDGLIVTNAHVVAGASRITATLADGEDLQAVVLGADSELDLAVLKVDETGLPVAPIGSSQTLQVGDDVIAIGNALGLDGDPTVTRGIVSAKDRDINTNAGTTLRNVIQTDAAINPGNSGGPLVNARGEVVGINTAVAGGADNIGFAIAITEVLPRIEELAAGEVPNRAFLGVRTLPIETALEGGAEVSEREGAYVLEVTPETAAARAGIEAGDVIIAVNGVAIASPEDLGNEIGKFQPGDTISVTVVRDGDELTLDAELVNRFNF